MKLLFTLVFVAGCVSPVTHDTVVTPVWPDAPSEAWAGLWTHQVMDAIDYWKIAIGLDCQFPVFVGDNGPEVTLVTPDHWKHAPEVMGLYDQEDGSIEIVGADPILYRGALLHELGHAIGLQHTTDVQSVMFPVYGDKLPTSADAMTARIALGCVTVGRT